MNQTELTAYFTKALKGIPAKEIQSLSRIYHEDKGFTKLSILEQDVKELLSKKPIQYITGIEYFYDRKFKVNKHVLIPRPETEELIFWIIADYKTQKEKLRCIDVGTGSGVIPVIIKSNFPEWMVSAIDVSSGALEVARSNAEQSDLEIDFELIDFLTQADSLGSYDLIISNPPYIGHEEASKMGENVLAHEPHLALFVDEPLLFYKRICLFAKDKLSSQGTVYVELNEFYAEESKELFLQYFEEVELKQDLQGKYRMLRAKRPLS